MHTAMKRLLLPALLLALPVKAQVAAPTKTIGLTLRTTVMCSGLLNNCIYPGVAPNTTGIVVARQAMQTTNMTDNLGDVWKQDLCLNFDGECIFHTNFKVQSGNVLIHFAPNDGLVTYLLLYDGVWDFTVSNIGGYNNENGLHAADLGPAECVNGGDCPYNWTGPIVADAGNLLVAFAVNGPDHLAVAGPGWTVEASNGQFAVEDMIAPVEGVYMGSLSWKRRDGSEDGDGHWLMGLAAFKRLK